MQYYKNYGLSNDGKSFQTYNVINYKLSGQQYTSNGYAIENNSFAGSANLSKNLRARYINPICGIRTTNNVNAELSALSLWFYKLGYTIYVTKTPGDNSESPGGEVIIADKINDQVVPKQIMDTTFLYLIEKIQPALTRHINEFKDLPNIIDRWWALLNCQDTSIGYFTIEGTRYNVVKRKAPDVIFGLMTTQGGTAINVTDVAPIKSNQVPIPTHDPTSALSPVQYLKQITDAFGETQNVVNNVGDYQVITTISIDGAKLMPTVTRAVKVQSTVEYVKSNPITITGNRRLYHELRVDLVVDNTSIHISNFDMPTIPVCAKAIINRFNGDVSSIINIPCYLSVFLDQYDHQGYCYVRENTGLINFKDSDEQWLTVSRSSPPIESIPEIVRSIPLANPQGMVIRNYSFNLNLTDSKYSYVMSEASNIEQVYVLGQYRR